MPVPAPHVPHRRSRGSRGGRDTSPSGRDWAWVCAQLERGQSADAIYPRLVERAQPRRGADADRYAQRTVERAGRHVAAMRAANTDDESGH